MPRKRIKAALRESREPAVLGDLDQRQLWSLTLGMGGGFESEAERRAAWGRWRAELIESINLGTRPAAFWGYEPDIPRALRGTGHAGIDDADPALRLARLRWLLGPGQDRLRAGETRVIQRDIELCLRELADQEEEP